MRTLAIALAAVGVAAAAGPVATAGAADPAPDTCFSVRPGMPPFGPGYTAGGAVLSPVWRNGVVSGGEASEAHLAALLGYQYAGAWVDAWRDGWRVGLAPGPLDVATARALIETRLLVNAPADVAAAAAASLQVVAQPYSMAELRVVQEHLRAFVSQPGGAVVGSFGISCVESGAFRLEVSFHDTTSAQDEARVRQELAQFGDRVVFIRRPGGGPVPALDAGTVPPSTTPAPGAEPPAATPSPRRRAAVARVRRVSRTGAMVRVTVACPRAAAAPCAGRLSVRVRGGRAPLLERRVTRLAPGAVRVFAARLTPRQRAGVSERGLRAVVATVRAR